MRKIINLLSIKKIKIVAVLTLLCIVSISGCAHTGGNNTTEPVNNTTDNSNGTYVYSTANVEKIDIMILESFPVQIQVVAEGYLPDGCTEISEVKTEKVGNAFNINISTIRPKDAVCTQALVNFTQIIPLEVQGLKAGNYTVNVNGVKGSFNLAVDNMLNGTPNSMPPRQQVVTEANNGKSINLKVGDSFYLRLPENPSTGYSWVLNTSQGLGGNLTGNYSSEQPSEGVNQPLVGAGGVRIWEIKANSTGSQQVNGIYKRSFENETGEEKKFTLKVEVS
jgi:inhibitor of cysteine peptidase